ncbi:sulfatase-like hydrolase/transferase, partial [Candidatus Poribacteria bacterium]|nr:sulfatase-like hydrolase/transferase [Candidatus Poribacteria bacterium]
NAPHYPMHAPQKYVDRFPDLPWDRQIMAAMVAAVDDGVGDICQALRDAGIDDDTLIFFSSDNGPSRETRNWLDGTEDPYYGGTAGIFRGHKFSLFDGGIRMPALMRYPARVPGGQVCDGVGAMMDVLPTCLEAAGIDLPDDRVIDGESVLSMVSEGAPSPHEQLCWENGNQLAVREGDWKLVLNGRLTGDSADEVHLSDLADDPGERVNLAESEPALVKRLSADVQAWYDEAREAHESRSA